MFSPAPFPDYALVDSGGGQKLERIASVLVRRPDPRAVWRPRLAAAAWRAADLSFELDPASGGKRGRWSGAASEAWLASYTPADPDGGAALPDVRFAIRPGSFRHVGVFPEQAVNWRWVTELATTLGIPPTPHPPTPRGRDERPVPGLRSVGEESPALLNLFGYTGIASLVARVSGFRVTHVDASKTALTGLRDNLAHSGLDSDGIRLILDDALAFTQREVRRGRRYAGILVDPPHHGRGPKGETWQLEEHLAGLVESCARLLDERAFLCLSTYATTTSPLGLSNLFLGPDFAGGVLEVGELELREESREGLPARALPCGACAHWSRGLGGGAQ